MVNKGGLMLGMVLLFILLLIVFTSLTSAQEVSYCCERTNYDAWCQNALQTECDTSGDYRSVPTSCQATSYCKSGTCVDTSEGICFENTPNIKCTKDLGGVWYDKKSSDVPLCQLGCCLIGDQAAFVTQTRCQKLSSFYGLEINFRTDIKNEIACIASATPKAKGACVFETQTGRTCRFITKTECQEMKTGNPSAEFHQGLLCSNPDLGADCSATPQTICVEGKDEVYFVDSCGNIANVYDSRYANPESSEAARMYWNVIQAPTCTTSSNPGSAGSATCGDCDYYLGSTCGEYRRGTDTKPNVGNYVCRDLSCKGYIGEGYTKSNPPKHGETWCANGKNLGITGTEISKISKLGNQPGSRDFRLVCYNSEVSVEPCADFRQEICIQSSVGEFKTAACRANLWRDCYLQDNKDDCENIDKRDCKWIQGISILTGEEGEELVEDKNGQLVAKEEDDNRIGASCVPLYPPGFDFWEEGTDAEDICSIADMTCVVRYEKGLLGEWKVVESRAGLWGKIMEFMGGPGKKVEEEELVCLDDEGNLVSNWKEGRKNICSALGDCGISKNYVNANGYYDEDDLFTIMGELGKSEEE